MLIDRLTCRLVQNWPVLVREGEDVVQLWPQFLPDWRHIIIIIIIIII